MSTARWTVALTICAVVLCVSTEASGRQLMVVEPLRQLLASQQQQFSPAEANKQADYLIASLNSTGAGAQASAAGVTILSEAISVSHGVQSTSIILTRLSDYVATTGCTPAVQSMLQDVVNNDYGGNPLPVTTALRSLDVKDTSVSNLGECFQIALSSEPAPEPSPSG